MKQRKMILALGTNAGGEAVIRKAYELLARQLGGLRMSRILTTEPVGIVSPPFCNALAEGTTSLSAIELRSVLKHTERLCGDSPELREKNIIWLDIDLLLLGGRRYKLDDWQRPYIRELIADASLNDK